MKRPSRASGSHKIAFDYLVVATGMQPSYFGHDEFARYAPGLKSLRRRRDDPGQNPERVRTGGATEDENERARQMKFVLVGAGPTGVELAASMAQMATVTLRGNFRRIDPAKGQHRAARGRQAYSSDVRRVVVRKVSDGSKSSA